MQIRFSEFLNSQRKTHVASESNIQNIPEAVGKVSIEITSDNEKKRGHTETKKSWLAFESAALKSNRKIRVIILAVNLG